MRPPRRTKIIPPKPAEVKAAVVSAVLEGKRGPPIWRDATPDELRMIDALGSVRFLPASFDKRFAYSLGGDGKISKRQAAYLRIIVIRYRRQIKADVVELAKASLSVNVAVP